ncbi:MAG: TetR/AcrR family transcriptional regulator [Ktedonobacteraceae bacterium]
MARTPKVVEDRREQIIDAAMRVFAQKGFVRATNKDVAREAGITPGLIYHYFESKEALLMAVIEGRTPLKVIASLPSNVLVMPPEQFFPFVIKQILTVVEAENFVALLKVVIPEMLNNESPYFVQIAPAAIQRVFAFLGQYLEAQMQLGTLRRADTVLNTQILFGSIVGVVLRRQVLRDPTALKYTQEQIATVITETFLHGLASS